MVKIVVTGISILSCLGKTQDTWNFICQGKRGIIKARPFSLFAPLPLGLINNHTPSPSLELASQLIEALCLDAQINLPAKDISVIIGSSRGCQSSWESLMSSKKSAESTFIPWLQTLPYQPAIVCASFLGTEQQIVSSPANACATGLVAIAQGYELIKQNRCSRVVVGAVESPITPLTIAGFSRMKALASEKCDPFGKDRDGFILAEGGAMLMLETEELALQRQAKIYGQLLGWSMNCDAEAMTAPSPCGKTAIQAINQCLQLAQLQAQEIDYIHAHGTGTILNDQREAKIIQELFPHFPKVSSTKGSTGHTLGASGAIASALNFLSLKQQKLLPNIAYSSTDFSLNLCQSSRNYCLENMLCFSFGFGGQNVVIAMGKY